MFVVKRDGRKEAVAFDKITARINKLCYGLDAKYVEPVIIAQKASTACTVPKASHGACGLNCFQLCCAVVWSSHFFCVSRPID